MIVTQLEPFCVFLHPEFTQGIARAQTAVLSLYIMVSTVHNCVYRQKSEKNALIVISSMKRACVVHKLLTKNLLHD